MLINMVPVRMDQELVAHLEGDVLTLNDQVIDLSKLAEGEIISAETLRCAWIVGEVTRVDKEVVLTLILPHGADAPEAARFPVPLKVTKSGPVPLPSAQETPLPADDSDLSGSPVAV